MARFRVLDRAAEREHGRGKSPDKLILRQHVMRRAMLWGKILHSPLAHARIVSIDASDARNLVGVKATNVVAEAVWCFGFFWFCRLYYGPRHHYPAMHRLLANRLTSRHSA